MACTGAYLYWDYSALRTLATDNGFILLTTTSGPPLPVASVTVAPGTSSLGVGQTQQLTTTLKDANGLTLTGRTVAWTTSNAAVATVSTSGLVTAVSSGSAAITATSEGRTGTATITVMNAVASVTVAPSSASVQVGLTQQLTTTLKDASGNTLTGRTVGWSSSNTGAASVSSSGLVTALATGAVTITATSEGKTGTATITVTPVVATQLALTTSAANAGSGMAFATQPVVTLRDVSGNTVTTAGNVVAMTVSAGASVVGAATATAVNGVARFVDVGISGTPGTTYTLTYSSGSLTSATQSILLQLVDRVAVCDRIYTSFCSSSGAGIFAGAVSSVRAFAYSAANLDVSASCVFVWAASVPSVVSIVPSTDATHRDAVITRLRDYTTVGVTASCQGQVGVFSP